MARWLTSRGKSSKNELERDRLAITTFSTVHTSTIAGKKIRKDTHQNMKNFFSEKKILRAGYTFKLNLLSITNINSVSQGPRGSSGFPWSVISLYQCIFTDRL